MKNSRLIRLLQALGPWELRALGDFVRSPYFNKHEGVLRLFGWLENAFPDFEEAHISKIRLCRELMDEPLSPQQLNDLATYLTRLVERFLAQQLWEEQPLSQHELLVQALRQRQLNRDQQRAYRKWQKALPEQPGPEDYVHFYRFEAEGMKTQVLERKRQSGQHFHGTLHAFDTYYLLNRLRYGCALINRREVVASEGDLSWARQISRYVAERPAQWQHAPLLLAYHHLFELLDSHATERFGPARRFLEQYHPQMPPESVRELYAHLMNFCIRKLNEGESDFQTLLFELYREQLDQGLLLENGEISAADYKNLVSLALRMGEENWAERFIYQYRDQLPVAQRQGAFTYQLASLHFQRRHYSESLRLLRDHEFEDPFYQLGARTLVLKIYMEQADYEGLYYAMEAFESFLQRHRKLASYQKELYFNLILFCRKLAKMQIQHQLNTRMLRQEQVQRFINRLERHKKIAQVDWLRDKTAHLLAELTSVSGS